MRWLLIVPACIFAWLAVVVLAIWTHGLVTTWLCPADLITSGFCEDEAIRNRIDLTYAFFAPISAFAVVVVAYLVAPQGKLRSALASLIAGSLVAAVVLWTDLLLTTATVAGGLFAYALLAHKQLPPPHNPPRTLEMP